MKTFIRAHPRTAPCLYPTIRSSNTSSHRSHILRKTICHYRYDEERRWLKQIETNNRLQTLQDSTYHFDAVGNITRIANSASRYTTVQEYEYDGLYQLTGAEGTFEDREYGSLTATHRYSQSFSYDQLGNLLTKESSNEVSPSGGSSGLNYRLEYDYYPDRPGCIGEQQPKAVTNLGSSTIVTDPVLTKR
jgi:hypothetical protein